MLRRLRRPKVEPKYFPSGLIELSNPADSIIDVVFIHDITEPRNEAWRSIDSNGNWIKDILKGPHADVTARILSFGYDASDIQTVEDLFDYGFLVKCANELLYWYPLYRRSTPESRPEGSGTASRTLPAGTEASRSTQPAEGRQLQHPIDISRPTIFVGHGFGGLIYEQALTLSYEADLVKGEEAEQAGGWDPELWYNTKVPLAKKEGERSHSALLFNTPLYVSGLCSWGELCASLLKIPCPKREHGGWETYEDQLVQGVVGMQRRFRRVLREVTEVPMWNFIGNKPMPKSGLRLPQDWTGIPDSYPVLLSDSDHVTLTRSTVDEDPDKIYLRRSNNTYKQTCNCICIWAENFIEGSSEIGRLVSQGIRTIRALLNMLASPDAQDIPSLMCVDRKGKIMLSSLEILRDSPMTRSRIIESSSRNDYLLHNAAVREVIQELQIDINSATRNTKVTTEGLAILLRKAPASALDKRLGSVAKYIDWAVNRELTGRTPKLLKNHLTEFRSECAFSEVNDSPASIRDNLISSGKGKMAQRKAGSSRD